MKNFYGYAVAFVALAALVIGYFIWNDNSTDEKINVSVNVNVEQMIADDYAAIEGEDSDTTALVFYESQIRLGEKLDSTYDANVVEVVNVFQRGRWNYQVKHVINDSIDERTINKGRGFWGEDLAIDVNKILPLDIALEAVANSEYDVCGMNNITIRKILGPNSSASENGFYMFGRKTCVDLTNEEVMTFDEMIKRVYDTSEKFVESYLKNDSITE